MDQSPTAAIHHEMEFIYRFYAGFVCGLDPDTGLGGRLLYTGEPAESGTQLLRAANIAGAASLAACADAPALRRMMREGALDFAVTGLDEALRILKNEIRKKQSVAVGVSLSAESIAREMFERGVQPDLLGPGLPAAPDREAFISRGARTVQPRPVPDGAQFNVISIPPTWKRPVAEFDALLLGLLTPGDHVNRRWVRLAPRYLPAAARRLRSIVCGKDAVSQLNVRLGMPDCQ